MVKNFVLISNLNLPSLAYSLSLYLHLYYLYITLLFWPVKEGPPDLVSPCELVSIFDFSTVFIFLAAQLSKRYKFFSVLCIKMADLEEILPEVFYLM